MQGRIPPLSPFCIRGRLSLRSEHGAALIEIMVGALLTAIVATAVFKGIDGASAVSGQSRARAAATGLAQDDQERLRATTPAGLVDYSNTSTVVRDNVTYTTVSSARWVADRDAVPDCNTSTSRQGYLRIESKVTWPDMRGSKPIKATSIVAAPNGTVSTNRGAFGVKVLGAGETPEPGVTVSTTAGVSGTTDANGCVFWDDLPQGNYSYTLSKAGHVDYNGASTLTRPMGITGGQTRLDVAYYDGATSLTVNVKTQRYGQAVANAVVRPAYNLYLTNAKMAALNGVRTTPLASASSKTVAQLFPMQYGAFAGQCEIENNPGNVAFDPPFTAARDIFLPSLNVAVSVGGATNSTANGLTVKIVQRAGGGGCGATYTATTAAVNSVNGRLAAPEFPYGTYAICAQRTNGGNTYHAKTSTRVNTTPATGDVVNSNAAGTAVNLNIPTNGGTNRTACP